MATDIPTETIYGTPIELGRFSTIAQIKRANRNAGYHFFEPDTLRFFDSKIGSTVYGGSLFITSERDKPRQKKARYTIRFVCEDGSIETVGSFQEYATKSAAVKVARAIVESL